MHTAAVPASGISLLFANMHTSLYIIVRLVLQLGISSAQSADEASTRIGW